MTNSKAVDQLDENRSRGARRNDHRRRAFVKTTFNLHKQEYVLIFDESRELFLHRTPARRRTFHEVFVRQIEHLAIIFERCLQACRSRNGS